MTPELQSRIQVPPTIRRGEVFAVKVALAHPMETGFRHDENGRTTPYNVINTFTCRYNGAVVLSSTFSSGIAANPSIQFYVKARESGELTFEWRDDEGREGRARVVLSVIPA
jgi:sulfur-oxidizing protein SoxZ